MSLRNFYNAAIGGSTSFLLDEYSGASVAYSLRRVNSAYTGPLIKVRETGGDTELDIGFTGNGTLDVDTLVSFCGGNDGKIVAWYDQSGNDFIMTQSTASLQPEIVSAGVLHTLNGKPSVVFDGTVGLTNASSLTYTDGIYFFGTVLANSRLSTTRFFTDDILGVQGYFTIPTSSTLFVNDNGTGFKNATLTGLSDSTQTSYSILFDQSTGGFEAYVNTSSVLGTVAAWTGPLAPSGSSNLGLGSAGNDAQFLDGQIQEVIAYTTDQTANREAIRENINNHYSIY